MRTWKRVAIVGESTKPFRFNLEKEAEYIFRKCQKKITVADQSKIGNTLRSSRKGQNLSLREVAKRMKLSAPYLSDLELGRRGWTQARVLQFMKAVHQKGKL